MSSSDITAFTAFCIPFPSFSFSSCLFCHHHCLKMRQNPVKHSIFLIAVNLILIILSCNIITLYHAASLHDDLHWNKNKLHSSFCLTGLYYLFLLLQLLLLILLLTCAFFSLIIVYVAFPSATRECLSSPCWTTINITAKTIASQSLLAVWFVLEPEK